MKRLPPNHIKVMLDIARTTEAMDLTDVAEVILLDAGFSREETAEVLSIPVEFVRPARLEAPKTRKASSSKAKSGARWTKADDDQIVDLWASGLTTGQIAKKLRRTNASVGIRISTLRSSGANIPVRNAAAGQRMKAYHNRRKASSKK